MAFNKLEERRVPGMDISLGMFKDRQVVMVDLLIEDQVSYYIPGMNCRISVLGIKDPEPEDLTLPRSEHGLRQVCLQSYRHQDIQDIQSNIYDDSRPVLRLIWTGEQDLNTDCPYTCVAGYRILSNKIINLIFYPSLNTGQYLKTMEGIIYERDPWDYRLQAKVVLGLCKFGYQSLVPYQGPRQPKTNELVLGHLLNLKNRRKVVIKDLRPSHAYAIEFGFIGKQGLTCNDMDPNGEYWHGYGFRNRRDFWARRFFNQFLTKNLRPLDRDGTTKYLEDDFADLNQDSDSEVTQNPETRDIKDKDTNLELDNLVQWPGL